MHPLKGLVRFGVSLDKSLLDRFDRLIRKRGRCTRSHAFQELVRQTLVSEEWTSNREVAATVTLVYHPGQREVVRRLLAVQHVAKARVLAAQHLHLDHDHCMEVLIARGRPQDLRRLADALKAIRGVKFGALNLATTGRDLP